MIYFSNEVQEDHSSFQAACLPNAEIRSKHKASIIPSREGKLNCKNNQKALEGTEFHAVP